MTRACPRVVTCFAMAAACLTLLSSARVAGACDCNSPTVRVWAYPSAGGTAPRDALPRFLLSVPPAFDRATAAAPYARVSMVCAPGGKVDVATTTRVGYLSALVELRPREPLPENARCAIVDPMEPSIVLNWFHVSGQRDTVAPRWAGILAGWVTPVPVSETICVDGSATGVLWIGDPSDDTTDARMLLAEVWLGENGEPIDFSAAPTTWLVPTPDEYCPSVRRGVRCDAQAAASRRAHPAGWVLDLDGGSLCRRGGTFPVPRWGVEARLGVRLVDMAGRVSKPQEVLVSGVPNRWQQASGIGRESRAFVRRTGNTPSPRRSWLRGISRGAALLMGFVAFAIAACAWLCRTERAPR